MAIELTDDGTLDTVLRCSDCGVEMRYNFDPDGTDERAAELRAEYTRQELQRDPNQPLSWYADRVEDRVNETLRDEFVTGCIEDATADHTCEPGEDDEPTEPDEDDITTEDHETFYQYGKAVITNARGRNDVDASNRWYLVVNGKQITFLADTCERAVREYMDRSQFWPNCWFISDHGNAHLMDLTEGK